jgi:hypothetical protein
MAKVKKKTEKNLSRASSRRQATMDHLTLPSRPNMITTVVIGKEIGFISVAISLPK